MHNYLRDNSVNIKNIDLEFYFVSFCLEMAKMKGTCVFHTCMDMEVYQYNVLNQTETMIAVNFSLTQCLKVWWT